MASRTTVADVEALLEEYDDEIPLAQFLPVGNNIVTNNCIKEDSEYNSETLELIERYLDAHLYEITRSRAEFRAAGKVQEAMKVKLDLGFNLTRYGQTAMLLDYEGGLAALNARITDPGRASNVRAGIVWLGLEEEEEARLQ